MPLNPRTIPSYLERVFLIKDQKGSNSVACFLVLCGFGHSPVGCALIPVHLELSVLVFALNGDFKCRK